MLWTLIKKELHEFSPVAAIGLVLSFLSPLLIVQSAHYYGEKAGSLLAMNSYRDCHLVFCCGVGVLLGFMMSWKESLKKTWHFLIHRPASKSQILEAKLLGGLILYLGAVGLPFLFLTVRSTVLGAHSSLWATEYVYPGLAALAKGLLLYLAAFLCGLRDARWYGTRFVPLVAAVELILLAEKTQDWALISAIHLSSCVLLLGAIWAAFVSARFLWPALFLVLCVGITAAVVRADYFAFETIAIRWVQTRDETYPCFATTGEPRLLVAHPTTGRTSYGTVDGCPVGDGSGAHASVLPMARGYPVSRRAAEDFGFSYRPYSVKLWDRPGDSRYFFLQPKEGLLVGYDRRTQQPVVYIGRSGFSAGKSAVQPFSDRGAILEEDYREHQFTCIKVEDGVFLVDFDRQRVTRIFDKYVWRISWDFDVLKTYDRQNLAHNGPWHFFLFGRDFVTVCDERGENARRFMLPKEVTVEPLECYRMGQIDENTLGLVVFRDFYHSFFPETDMYKIDSQGTILWAKHIATPRDLLLANFPVWTVGISPFVRLLTSECEWYHLGTRESDPFVWWPLFGTSGVFIVKLLWAALTFYLLRKWAYSWVAKSGWSFFAFLGGLPVLLTVWALLLNEKRVRCPACGGKRPPSRPECPCCAAPWPAPERRETDMFAADSLAGSHP
ncbi:MAG: hypothetical protein NTW87_10445 [Planctomycetota bacterium]|nr:hypothetical protein [Planctomycetota bacterium]